MDSCNELAAYVLWLFRLPESNIIMIYILGILLSSYIAIEIYALYSSLIQLCLSLIFLYGTIFQSEGI